MCELIDFDITKGQISTSPRLQTEKRANEKIIPHMFFRVVQKQLLFKKPCCKRLFPLRDPKKWHWQSCTKKFCRLGYAKRDFN